MHSQYHNRKPIPARFDQYQRDQRSGAAAIAHPNAAAGFMTARDTARDTERSTRETVRHMSSYQGFDSDMHTARGFETDDYLSAVEPNTSRSTGTFMEVQMGTVVGRP